MIEYADKFKMLMYLVKKQNLIAHLLFSTFLNNDDFLDNLEGVLKRQINLKVITCCCINILMLFFACVVVVYFAMIQLFHVIIRDLYRDFPLRLETYLGSKLSYMLRHEVRYHPRQYRLLSIQGLILQL